MVVLLVAHDIYHVVELVLLEAAKCRAKVLCHIYRRAIATKEKLLVKTISLKVNPYRVVLLTEEYTLLEAILHEALAKEICLRLVVYLVKVHAHGLVCHIEALVYPAVHPLPKSINLGVFSLPLA